MAFIDLVPNPAIRRRELVRGWLTTRGWEIVGAPLGRISLVAKKGGIVVFVTVHGAPKEVPRQRDRGWIAKAALPWKERLGTSYAYRFDAVSFAMKYGHDDPKFRYIPNAWSV